MRCHYEILGVSRDADDAEIKKSYRKLAIQYHPDKNPDRVEEVTKMFHEIQGAYEVLSDKQERAWYDKHREAILKGGDDFVDDSLDVMHYFNPSVYCGFGDDAQGFYSVFGDVFARIAQEDEPYLEGDAEYDVPTFGDSKSDYIEVVKPFYSYWLGYCTKKTYVWKEKYDLRQAPNRPTQRLMEKENKKFRDAAKRKRNEEVRALAAFVRKRDKRFQAYRKELEAKQAENKRKLEKHREEEIRKNNQVLENYQEQEWEAFDHSKLDDIDSHFDEQFGVRQQSDSDYSDEDKIENFYCIACDKNFKSDKALANHEKSKKHKENVDLIKSELGDDLLEDLHIRGSKSSEDFDVQELEVQDEENEDDCNFDRLDSMSLPEHVVKMNIIEKAKVNRVETTESNLIHTTDSLLYLKQRGTTSSPGSLKVKEKKKKGAKLNKTDEELEEEWALKHGRPSLSTQDSLALPRKKTKKKEVKEAADRVRQEDELQGNRLRNASLGKSSITDSLRLKRPTKADRKKGRRKLLDIEEDAVSDEEEDDSNSDAVFDSNGEMTKSTTQSSDEFIIINVPGDKNTNATDEVSNTDDDGKENLPLLHRSIIMDSIRYNKDHMDHHGKSTLQKKYKEALQAENEELRSAQVTEENSESSDRRDKPDVLFTCSTCAKDFPTRNKLFGHIKAEGHAEIKQLTKTNSKKGKGKKR